MSTIESRPRADIAELSELLAAIAAGAGRRERDHQPPYEEIRRLADAGVGALRVPVELGGGGATIRELLAFVIDLAAADSNIAQSLRSHYLFVEARLASPRQTERERWLPVITGGALFGNGTIERHTTDLFGFETTLTPDGDGYRLNGEKYYSTGTLYADYASVMAVTPDQEVVAAVVPTARDGVTLEDDWDGMGQRLTASGTTRFADVSVAADEVLRTPRGNGGPTIRSAFLQLYLVAISAGITRAAAHDAAELARRRKRTFSHGSGDLPASDPLIQTVVGEIAASAFACETSVAGAAEALDAAALSGPEGAMDPALAAEASLRSAKAQVVAAELAPRAAEALFDAGGASATSRELNLDRHWRNARTLASHNPAMYKARAIGDLLINHTELPDNGFF